MKSTPGLRLLILMLLALPLRGAEESDPASLLAKIRAVRPEGEGNAEAGTAVKALIQLGPKALLPALGAMTENDAVVNNWLRPAIDAIAEKVVVSGGALPVKELERFIRDHKHSGPARRLAYDWLVRADDTTPARLLPGMLDDPSGELRRDAVARVITKGEDALKAGNKGEAIQQFQTAFEAARDSDQVDSLAGKFDKLGVKVDVAAHYGFIQSWQILSPFDNTRGGGYQVSYPPEKKVEPGKTYQGKNGAQTKWTEHTTTDPHGIVDLNKVLGKLKGTAVFAHAVIESPREQKVELRAGGMTALKIYLNGRLVFAREEYHHGMTMDQHVGFGTLRAGRNEVLVKVCQNEQTESWAQDWKYQLRLCDALGAAVPFKVVNAPMEKKEDGK
jgi:hypothetical protein